MKFFLTLACFLVPGLLLGFGLAVFPRRELLVGRCILLDMMALWGMGAWVARELRAGQNKPPVKLISFQR